MSRRNQSGSPSAWKLRRVEYQKRSGPCSNPGQPSSVNRKARRKPKQPKTAGTIGLRPNLGVVMAAMVMLATPENLRGSDES